MFSDLECTSALSARASRAATLMDGGTSRRLSEPYRPLQQAQLGAPVSLIPPFSRSTSDSLPVRPPRKHRTRLPRPPLPHIRPVDRLPPQRPTTSLQHKQVRPLPITIPSCHHLLTPNPSTIARLPLSGYAAETTCTMPQKYSTPQERVLHQARLLPPQLLLSL